MKYLASTSTTAPRSHHLTKLGADEKQTISRSEVEMVCYGRISHVSESGLYKPVMRSDKPQAKAFQDWVVKVVLPAIRKDGAYVKYICRVFSPPFSFTSCETARNEAPASKVTRQQTPA